MNLGKLIGPSLTCIFLLINSTYAQTSKLTVVDSSGKTQVLNLNDRCLVFGVATWCSHSLELKKLINYSSINSDVHRARIIFLFENNEWPTIEEQLREQVEAKQMTSDDAEDELAELKERAQGSSLFYPEFLKDAGCECYQLPANSTARIVSFPSLYSAEKHAFVDWNPKVFLKYTSTENLVTAIDAIYPKQ
jgi:hypothetical protein